MIATGLDDRYVSRRPEAPERSISNVTRLRRESEPPPREDGVRAFEPREIPVASPPSMAQEVRPEPAREIEAPAPPGPSAVGDWMSPFEDELDVPTFLRRNPEGEEEKRELPAFLRRSAD